MSRTAPPESVDGVAAVDRALAIVDAIAQTTEPISLADLSRVTGFYKSTLLRLIASLERSNLVVRRADGRYALGLYAHQLGRAYEAAYHLTDVLQPILQALVDQGTESASFHAYHDPQSRICLLRIDSLHSTLDRIRAGDLLPLDKGAAGKLLTAYRVLGERADAAGLVATSMGERDPSCAAVASPVFGPDDEIRGVISLSGPKERFTAAAIKKMSQLLQDSAARATRSLGGRWPG
ncbi:IclR family transcriptional regulator [Bordetella sp. 02P26C-1]|uniref:IclR family transcriptional regulator n=1 Tax=Bordetella sp. 02P26C-1 TaxID=2683195 RepID=UPI0013538782|nr:helix-turn-helix domain-containing protein [Bordetella sp. 02P26C-1]MVW77647.1 helix-turn-helix domain-containing protein [Bordetella sp. 02P26C-1]